MGGTRNKRDRMWIAHSSASGVTVVVVELRSTPPRSFEKVLRGVREAYIMVEEVELAFWVARELGLKDFEVTAASGLVRGDFNWLPEFGLVRSGSKHGKKGRARSQARRRLRELVPRPPRVEQTYSLADYSIDLEIARLTEEAAEGIEIWDDEGFSSWHSPCTRECTCSLRRADPRDQRRFILLRGRYSFPQSCQFRSQSCRRRQSR